MVSQRGNTTRQVILQMTLTKAVSILQNDEENTTRKGEIILDVANQKNEPLLNFTDYLCWAVQRKYEKGEERFYNFIESKIKEITEL